MNELLVALKPLNPCVEPLRVMMLEQFKSFMLDYDIEHLNNGSFKQYSNGMEFFFRYYRLNAEHREIVVIASVLSWLASNCGRSFLHEAEKLAAQFNRRKGYIYAWADENQRMAGTNNGFTLLEHLLTPYEYHDFNHGLSCAINTFVSVNDLEIANCLIHWLAEGDGQVYLDNCKAQGLFYDWGKVQPKAIPVIKKLNCHCPHWRDSSFFYGETHTCADCGGEVTI